jgi:hypothetical protein
LLPAKKVKPAMQSEQVLLAEQAEQLVFWQVMQLPARTEKPFMQAKQTPVELQVRQLETWHETQAPW